jgi:RNA polymerase sigma-70 factor, ECF subfamily
MMVDELASLDLTAPPDAATVGRLFDAFYDPIYRYCLRRLYFRQIAEDAVSEVFLTMARRIGEFRGKGLQDFRAWIYVIAANRVNQVIRQQFRERRLLDALAERTPEGGLDGRERRWAALHQVLLTLDEQEQHLVCLRFFERLSHEEIGRMIGKRAGAVRVRIHRALKKLRPVLERTFDDQCAWEDSDGR